MATDPTEAARWARLKGLAGLYATIIVVWALIFACLMTLGPALVDWLRSRPPLSDTWSGAVLAITAALGASMAALVVLFAHGKGKLFAPTDWFADWLPVLPRTHAFLAGLSIFALASAVAVAAHVTGFGAAWLRTWVGGAFILLVLPSITGGIVYLFMVFSVYRRVMPEALAHRRVPDTKA